MNLREWLISRSQIDILMSLNRKILDSGHDITCLANVLLDVKESEELDEKCDLNCLKCLCGLLDSEYYER